MIGGGGFAFYQTRLTTANPGGVKSPSGGSYFQGLPGGGSGKSGMQMGGGGGMPVGATSPTSR